MFEISKNYTFDSAHSLPHLPEEHKCHHLHGHTYGLTVTVAGPLNELGWVQDYGDISDAVNPLLSRIDHKNLNDILTCVTTAEMLAIWIYEELKVSLPLLVAIEVRETANSNVVYRP